MLTDIRSPVTQIMSAGPIGLNRFMSELAQRLDHSQEQLRYNWVRSVRLMRTVRQTGLANFLRKSKNLSKNGKNDVSLKSPHQVLYLQ
jgi:hypothetical protein